MKKETSSWVKPMQPKAWSDIARNTEPVGTLVYSEERMEKPDPCRQKTHCRFSMCKFGHFQRFSSLRSTCSELGCTVNEEVKQMKKMKKKSNAN